MDSSENKQKIYPAMIFRLDDFTEEAYEEGGRYAVEFLDGGQVHFRTKEGCVAFAGEQGLMFVAVDEMQRLREAYSREGEDGTK